MAEPTHIPGMTPRVAQRDSEHDAYVIEQLQLAEQPVEHLRLECDVALTTSTKSPLSGLLDSAVDRAWHQGIPLLQIRRSGSGVTDVGGDLARWAAMLAPFVVATSKAIDHNRLDKELATFGDALLDIKRAQARDWTIVTALFESSKKIDSVWLVDIAGVLKALAVPAMHDTLIQLVATYVTATLSEPNFWDELRKKAVRKIPSSTAVGRDFAPTADLAGWPDEGLPVAPATPLDRLAAARARREAILADGRWLTSDEVALEARGALVDSNAAQYASRLRREGRLFGVRVRGQYRHPEFQFQKNGEVHPAMAKLIALLPTSEANWTAAFWLFQLTRALEGRRPVDVFPADPQRVIDFAEREFRGDHGRW